MSLAILRTNIGDFDILEAELILVLIGTPSYYVTIDGDEAPSGTVEISFASGRVFTGTVARAVPYEGRIECVIVGGGGGLSGEPESRVSVIAAGYTGMPLTARADLLIGDILTLANERLSEDATALVEALSLPRWQRVAGLARHALGALARALGVSWRVRSDGFVWLGEETYPDYADESNIIVQRDVADIAELHCALTEDRPDIEPGCTIFGRRIVGVTYILTGDALRARLRYETDAGGMTLRASLDAALGATATVYAGNHVARVVKANPDGTVDLMPANTDVGAATGINAVPFRMGLAGARQVLSEGAEVVLRFGSSTRFPCGDPSLPYCEAAAQDPTADRNVARKGDEVAIGQLSWESSATPVPTVIFTYQRYQSPFDNSVDLGQPPQFLLAGTANPPIGSIDLSGWITTGSLEVFLRKLATEEID